MVLFFETQGRKLIIVILGGRYLSVFVVLSFVPYTSCFTTANHLGKLQYIKKKKKNSMTDKLDSEYAQH